jgi:hypothetical protein
MAMAVVFLVASAAQAAAPGSPDFNRDIRPILSGRCFAATGPTTETVGPAGGDTPGPSCVAGAFMARGVPNGTAVAARGRRKCSGVRPRPINDAERVPDAAQ